MPTKVDFEMLKNQDIPNKLRILIESTVTNNFGMQDYYYQWLDNLELLLNTLAKSSTLAHLAHKKLSQKEQKPFDKLRHLWTLWVSQSYYSDFETFVQFNKIAPVSEFGDKENYQKVHNWLAEYCGFLTTAEVRKAIQYLKNS